VTRGQSQFRVVRGGLLCTQRLSRRTTWLRLSRDPVAQTASRSRTAARSSLRQSLRYSANQQTFFLNILLFSGKHGAQSRYNARVHREGTRFQAIPPRIYGPPYRQMFKRSRSRRLGQTLYAALRRLG